MDNQLVQRIQKKFASCEDFIVKEIPLSKTVNLTVLYLESVSSSNLVHDFILQNISLLRDLGVHNFRDLNGSIPAPHCIFLSDDSDVEFYLTNGFTIVIKGQEILALETRADIHRSVSEPSTEQSIVGPKDAFTESIQINLGLIKRRIKTSSLKSKSLFIGRKTKTLVQLIYLDDVCDSSLVEKIYLKLNQIDVDSILDSGQISEYLSRPQKTPFPTILKSERPDQIASSILNGKVAILVDTSPFVLALPSFFGDFINPITDQYDKGFNVNFLKVIRLFCFFFTMMIPALYIALINYNEETIPTSLLLNFSIQRSDIPFPSVVEAFLILFVYEILRESDIRSPSPYGSAISILGALVLGDAAVSAGFVSPIMIIVVALTFITSLVFTEQELISAARFFRILFLLSASLFGLYGIWLAFIYFCIHMFELQSMGYPYFYPIVPGGFKEMIQQFLQPQDITHDCFRNPLLAKKNLIKQRRKP